MASINPSLKKNQEIITKVRRNTVEKLTDDLKYVVHVFWYQSTFTVFPSCNCVFEKKKKKKDSSHTEARKSNHRYRDG